MNTFGDKFRITVFGESHGAMIGVVIDGCPAGITLNAEDFKDDLLRRKSGATGTTARTESDAPTIATGVYNGYTTGAPITILFENKNTCSKDYEILHDISRPSHADFVLSKKWNGFNDPRGGGHSSGRLTLALVAAGVIAKKIITPIKINAELVEVGGSADITKSVKTAMIKGDSVGGIVRCIAENMPVGWGDPFFNSTESLISHLIFSIPGINGIEFGKGFEAAKMYGSEHNDMFISVDGKTATNNAGGINGGITNGNDLVFHVSIKPTSSITKQQRTMNMQTGELYDLRIPGRHDSCFALRMPVIVEAATAIVLAGIKNGY